MAQGKRRSRATLGSGAFSKRTPKGVLQRTKVVQPLQGWGFLYLHPGWRSAAAPGSLPWAMLSDPVGVKSLPLRPLLGAFLKPTALPVVPD